DREDVDVSGDPRRPPRVGGGAPARVREAEQLQPGRRRRGQREDPGRGFHPHALHDALPAPDGARARGLIEMSDEDREDTTTYQVVVNHEEQYSIWPADRE